MRSEADASGTPNGLWPWRLGWERRVTRWLARVSSPSASEGRAVGDIWAMQRGPSRPTARFPGGTLASGGWARVRSDGGIPRQTPWCTLSAGPVQNPGQVSRNSPTLTGLQGPFGSERKRFALQEDAMTAPLFMFATGIENSYPTMHNRGLRVD